VDTSDNTHPRWPQSNSVISSRAKFPSSLYWPFESSPDMILHCFLSAVHNVLENSVSCRNEKAITASITRSQATLGATRYFNGCEEVKLSENVRLISKSLSPSGVVQGQSPVCTHITAEMESRFLAPCAIHDNSRAGWTPNVIFFFISSGSSRSVGVGIRIS
jgi:hypothetical protein